VGNALALSTCPQRYGTQVRLMFGKAPDLPAG
jgi:hypothetical protein